MKYHLTTAALALFCMTASDPVVAQVVALGASNTAGKGVARSDAFPAQLAAILRANGRPMQVRNAGVSGDTTSGMLARLNAATPAGTRFVIVQYGGNDSRQGITDAQRTANIAAIEQRLAAKGIRTIDADGLVRNALRSGLRQADGIHLTPDGHKQVAQQLAASVQ
jgi:acyl-CoA thioesterase I